MRAGRIALVLALALIAGPAAAQEAPPLPVTGGEEADTPATPPRAEPLMVTTPAPAMAGLVVTIDQDRLFAGTAWGRRLEAEFEAGVADLAAENERLAAQLSEEEAQLTQQRAEADPAEFRKLAEAFDARATDIRRERAQAVQDLNAQAEADQTAFFRAIAPLMGGLMQERGAVVVLDRRTVLLSAEGIDITDDLIARIDAELGDGADQPVPEPATPEATPEPGTGTGSEAPAEGN